MFQMMFKTVKPTEVPNNTGSQVSTFSHIGPHCIYHFAKKWHDNLVIPKNLSSLINKYFYNQQTYSKFY